MMVICYIGIGSNLGDRERNINKAILRLKKTDRVKVERVSSIYETDPVSGRAQGKFLNGVLKIATSLSPRGLLERLNGIEKELGRTRTFKNAPRTIDLDILYYGGEIVNGADLTIPHPRIKEREFVLRGLRELGVYP